MEWCTFIVSFRLLCKPTFGVNSFKTKMNNLDYLKFIVMVILMAKIYGISHKIFVNIYAITRWEKNFQLQMCAMYDWLHLCVCDIHKLRRDAVELNPSYYLYNGWRRNIEIWNDSNWKSVVCLNTFNIFNVFHLRPYFSTEWHFDDELAFKLERCVWASDFLLTYFAQDRFDKHKFKH
jgi:hypothetical protein